MDVDLAGTAALIADPSRAAMLGALLSGGRHSARELAVAAGVAPSTATEHLDRLERGGLVVCERVGRRREVRLAGPEVGRALEALAAVAPPVKPAPTLRAWRHGEALRAARSCYDHLAGQAGVALADGLVAAKVLTLGDGGFAITPSGARRLDAFGLDVAAVLGAKRSTARACVDWSERRPHVGGALGAALLDELLRRGWLTRPDAKGRVLRVTDAGRAGLPGALGVALTG